MTDTNWFTRGGAAWQKAVYDSAETYIDDLPEWIGPVEVEYEDPWDEMLDGSHFSDVEVSVLELEREWDVDSIVGYVFSLSYCSPAVFGDEMDAFEAALRAHLDGRGGNFHQDVEVEVISARRVPPD